MEYRTLGKTKLKVSVVGFGCWAMGGGWGKRDDKNATAAVGRALDLGINFFDTADTYGLGHSEEVLGKALGNRRKEAIIATKFGLHWDENGSLYRSGSRHHIMHAIEGSLKRLKTDYIDLYQVHWPDLNTPFETTMKALKELLKSGKVRYIGVSNFSVRQIKQCIITAPIHSLQPRYSMLTREIEKSIMPFCRREGIGLATYGTLAYGILTGKFNRNSKFPRNDWRSGEMLEDADMWQDNVDLFQGKQFKNNLRVVRKLQKIAGRIGITMGQLAIAWVLSKPAISSAIVGAKRPSQAEENARAGDIKLSKAELWEINQILKEHA